MPTEPEKQDLVREARELARTPLEANQFARRSRELLRLLADECERLRQWKQEALPLLTRYDNLAETFGGRLGS